jgi:hypothetical protein
MAVNLYADDFFYSGDHLDASPTANSLEPTLCYADGIGYADGQ